MEFEQLMARARAGDVEAQTEAGKQLLFGAAPVEGVVLLHEAARRGGGEALTQLAVLAAGGVLEPRDLGKARGLLAQAAERGWAPAQAQLRVLEASGGASAKRMLSEQPRLRVIEGFASAEECAWLIERARDHLQRATIYKGSTALEVSQLRTNTECNLMLPLLDVVSCALIARAARLAEVTPAFCEVAKVLHYAPGESFGPHGDFQDVRSPSLREDVRRNGQRIATFLIYLNDDYEGGETDFIKAGVRFKGRTGDALLFVNVDDAGAPDHQTLHQGLAPTRGEKWLFSQWMRGKPINIFATPEPSAELGADWARSI